MASTTLTEGNKVAISPFGNADTEIRLCQAMINNSMGTGKLGLTLAWVYDDVARTLTCTFSGTAA